LTIQNLRSRDSSFRVIPYARFSDKLKTGVPQTGQLYIQKNFTQRIKKRPTDEAHRHLIKLQVKIRPLNLLVVFPSVGLDLSDDAKKSQNFFLTFAAQ
jgi:hypothetical protein